MFSTFFGFCIVPSIQAPFPPLLPFFLIGSLTTSHDATSLLVLDIVIRQLDLSTHVLSENERHVLQP